MIKDKDAPDEVVHIRQAWIKAINRVAEAIAFRYRNDITIDGGYASVENVGLEIVVESVIALKSILVDYGEATIASDVMRWHNENCDKIKKGKMGRMMFYRRWFEYMVQTLNKYGMLFDSLPKDYSNVEMKSV